MKDQNAPKCPSVKRLRELINWLEIIIKNTDRNDFISKEHAVLEVINALEWLETHLSNRNLYHKRQQLIRKHALRLAKEHGLLDSDFKQAVDAETFEVVANEEPEED